jgi:hypothetical protein
MKSRSIKAEILKKNIESRDRCMHRVTIKEKQTQINRNQKSPKRKTPTRTLEIINCKKTQASKDIGSGIEII